MDKKTLQQLMFTKTLLEKWKGAGAKIWDFSGNIPTIHIKRVNMNCENLEQLVISEKRKGNYAESLGGYMQLIGEQVEQKGKIPISYVRGLFKVLVCANAFQMAYTFIATVLADMEQGYNVNPRERQLLNSYFQDMNYIAIRVSDYNDTSEIHSFAANFSGSSNYQLIRSMTEIKDDFLVIRGYVRQMYGK